jgi:tetratricopeptide (TPR) repeat protein
MLSASYDVLDRLDDGARMRREAAPLVERLGDPRLRVRLATEEANGALEQHDGDAALARFDAARTLSIQRGGPDSGEIADIEEMIASVYRERGDLAAALDHSQRALAIRERVYGPDNPYLLHDLHAVGGDLLSRGDLDGALAVYARAERIASSPGVSALDRADATGRYAEALSLVGRSRDAIAVLDRGLAALSAADPVEQWSLVADRGTARLADRQPEAALADFDRALALRAPLDGPSTDAGDLAWLHERRGDALRELGRDDEAFAAFDRAAALRAAIDDPIEGDAFAAELGRGKIRLAQGRPADALGYLERALAPRRGLDLDPAGKADAELTTARALIAAHRDRARARALAVDARAIVAALPHAQDQLADVDAFLRATRP